MACSMNSGVFLSDSSLTKLSDRNPQMGCSPSIQLANSQFLAQPLLIAPNQNSSKFSVPKSPKKFSVNVSYYLNKSLRWWEKTIKPNMIDIKSANELADTLKNSGDKLVVVDFYSLACGAGCKALHPKICQLAESNPYAIFLKVNHEELNKMCHALHIHVLPFFRFYKGSKGRLCSFSCTVSTIKKFRAALAKHKTEVQSNLVGPSSKGLEESELIQLASIGEISLYPEKQLTSSIVVQEEIDNLLRTIQNPSGLTPQQVAC